MSLKLFLIFACYTHLVKAQKLGWAKQSYQGIIELLKESIFMNELSTTDSETIEAARASISSDPSYSQDSESNPSPRKPKLVIKPKSPPSPNKTYFKWFSGLIDAFFEPARTANALGNGAISASAGHSNPALLVLGLITGTINSYASGEARETNKVTNAPPYLWWADRLISLIYGLGCGLTTAASAHAVFTLLGIILGGTSGLVSFGILIGLMSFISARSRLGNLRALLLGLTVSAIYISLALALISFVNPLMLIPILFVSTYLLSIALGFCTTILNYGITQDSIISLVMHDEATREFEATKPFGKTTKEKINFNIIFWIAAVSCLASGLAIGGLTYISILSLPAAFGFAMPLAPLLVLAIFIATITTAAMVPLLIKQCTPIAEVLSKIKMADIPKLIVEQCKALVHFDTALYKDTFANRLKFYFKSFLLAVIVPLAIVGSVLTMMQASNALAQVIKETIQAIPLTVAESLAIGTLTVALGSDLVFSISTTSSWMKNSTQLTEAQTMKVDPTVESAVIPMPTAAPTEPEAVIKPSISVENLAIPVRAELSKISTQVTVTRVASTKLGSVGFFNRRHSRAKTDVAASPSSINQPAAAFS